MNPCWSRAATTPSAKMIQIWTPAVAMKNSLILPKRITSLKTTATILGLDTWEVQIKLHDAKDSVSRLASTSLQPALKDTHWSAIIARKNKRRLSFARIVMMLSKRAITIWIAAKFNVAAKTTASIVSDVTLVTRSAYSEWKRTGKLPGHVSGAKSLCSLSSRTNWFASA